MGLLIYHLEYQTTQIPTGFVSVAISGGFCENWARLTGNSGSYVFARIVIERISVSHYTRNVNNVNLLIALCNSCIGLPIFGCLVFFTLNFGRPLFLIFLCFYLFQLPLVTLPKARHHLHISDYWPIFHLYLFSRFLDSDSLITDSVYKLKRYGERIQPCLTRLSKNTTLPHSSCNLECTSMVSVPYNVSWLVNAKRFQ